MTLSALVQVLLIGLVSNLDNLGVGIAYGARRIAVPPLPNVLMATVAFAFTVCANWLGRVAGQWLSPSVARAVGAGVLVVIGMWVLASHWRPRQETAQDDNRAKPRGSPTVLSVWRNPEQADRDASGSISIGESFVLGIALAMNCLTNGFVTGLWGLGAVAAGLSNAVFSYVTLAAGVKFGSQYAASRLGDKATVAAGCLLILIGLGQLL